MAAVVRDFGWIEYTTMWALLSIPALIGIYYGCIKANQNSVIEYIHGGKNMKIFPIVLSLIASNINPLYIMGYPAETYEFGLQIIMEVVGTLAVVYFINECFLAVFYDLQLNSSFKYLELRFSSAVRKISSFMYLSAMIFYLPIIMYVPALAFYQVTGIDFHVVLLIFTASCVFYTSIGGLKTVVWSSTIYTFFNVGVILIVFILGTIESGGLQKIYKANARTDRWEIFNFDPSPFMRVTFWSASFGAFSKLIVSIGINPGAMQRFLSLPTKKAAKWTTFWDALGISAMIIICSLLGLIMYASNDGCDPLAVKIEVRKSAQLLPHFVQKISVSLPGMTGFFVSSLMGSASCAMSGGFNTIAGTLYEDFISNLMPRGTEEKTASTIMKIIVVIVGITCVGVVYIIERLGTLMDMGYSLCACQSAALFTVYALGMFHPSSNTTGAICGMVSSIVFMAWVVIGRQLAMSHQQLVYLGKMSRIDTCPKEWNFTTPMYPDLTAINSNVLIHPNVSSIYAVSFLYFTLMGGAVGILVGVVVSLLTGGKDLKQLNPKLIVPMLRKYLPGNSVNEWTKNSYKLAEVRDE